MTTARDLLQQGIESLKAGHKAEARRLLMQVVQEDKRNEIGWLRLSPQRLS
jgi:Tfp pilus assembly protein PilF